MKALLVISLLGFVVGGVEDFKHIDSEEQVSKLQVIQL
jgi:hypothetical protein